MSADLAQQLLLKTLLPLSLLIAAGGIWPRWQSGISIVGLRGEINRLVLNFFAPMLFFSAGAAATVDFSLLQVPLAQQLIGAQRQVGILMANAQHLTDHLNRSTELVLSKNIVEETTINPVPEHINCTFQNVSTKRLNTTF